MSDTPADPADLPRDEGAERQDAHPLRRVTLQNYQSLIDQQMREAEAAGAFHNLPGAGKPLKLDDDAGVPEDLRLANRMLKGSGYAPPWIELQKSIREEQDELAGWLARANGRWTRLPQAEQAALRAEYEQRLRDLNKLITTYNLSAPPVAGQLPLLQPWRELRKLGG
jgi:hypothetical protein